MHAPDGFLEPGTALATAVMAIAVLAFALRRSGHQLQDRQLPLAGIAAAFVFAAQMFNFPVAAGTTGHLLGGALVAVLLGPAVGSLVVAVVVVVQALLFADGGLSALGYNTLNMAVVPAYGGYAAYLLFRRLLPRNRGGVVGATGLAAAVSVVLSSVAFSIQWLFGASAPVAFDDVFSAMVGVHTLIGLGEGILSAMVVATVLASRPDLVTGARDLDPATLRQGHKVPARTFIIGGVIVSFLFAAVISQFAVDNPDGLERVAEDQGFAQSATGHAFDNSIFADYATAGVENQTLSLAIAGVSGTVVALAVGLGLIAAARGTGGRPQPSERPAPSAL